ALGDPLLPRRDSVLVELDEDPLSAAFRRRNPGRRPIRERGDCNAVGGSGSDSFGTFDPREPAQCGHLTKSFGDDDAGKPTREHLGDWAFAQPEVLALDRLRRLDERLPLRSEEIARVAGGAARSLVLDDRGPDATRVEALEPATERRIKAECALEVVGRLDLLECLGVRVQHLHDLVVRRRDRQGGAGHGEPGVRRAEQHRPHLLVAGAAGAQMRVAATAAWHRLLRTLAERLRLELLMAASSAL